MTVSTLHSIPVYVTFPNGDLTATPTVSNDTRQQDVIPATASGIEWSFSAPANNDNLTITNVKFYTDAAKSNEVTPAYLGTGRNNGRMNWIVDFTSTAVTTETTLYYDLFFKDDDHTGLDWDPTVKIQPRGT